MMKRYFLLLCLLAVPFSGGGVGASAQSDSSRIRVSVVLVQLNVAVTDNKGNYISGLGPEDFAITEDKIPQKTATFEEGNGPTRSILTVANPEGKAMTAVADSPGGQDSPRAPNALPAPTCSSSSTPATTCIADSFLRRTPYPSSSALWNPLTASPSIPTAAICPGHRS